MCKFFITNRNGKKALWISTKTGTKRNIWDLPENLVTQDVLDAIYSAVQIGRETAIEQIIETISSIQYSIYGDISNSWKEIE